MYSTGFVFFISNLVGTILGLIFLVLCVSLCFNNDYKTKLIPLKVMFFFLVTLEIIKIYYLIASTPGFRPKSYPIIYCSSVMYLLFIVCWTKKDSLINRMGKGALIIPFLVMGILYHFVFPNMDRMMSLRNFILNVHSRTYHLLAMYVAIYMIIMKLYDFRFKDFLPVSMYSAIYFQFCTILSLLIGGEISNFGPLSKELGFLYEITGYATGNLLLGVLAIFVGFIAYGSIYLIRKRIDNKRNKLVNVHIN